MPEAWDWFLPRAFLRVWLLAAKREAAGKVHAAPWSHSPVPVDALAARIVAALHDPHLRDIMVAQHTRENAEAMSSLWRGLIRRTPRSQVAPVAEALAFSSWLAGNGAEAWVAIDLIDDLPGHRLADIVSAALQVAAPPHIWDRLRSHARHGPHALGRVLHADDPQAARDRSSRVDPPVTER